MTPWLDPQQDAPNPFLKAGLAARAYQRVRPAYPATLIERLPVGDIVDIGAGTGKLTAQLVDRLAGTPSIVTAVEPSAAMRASFLADHPAFPVERLLSTTAEATGLPARSADVVTFGQSWHWVDPATAAREVARILRPGGTVAILFNQLDVRIGWVKRLTRIMRSGDVHRPTPPPLGEEFSLPALHTASWVAELSPAQVLELGRTRSSWIRSTEANREHMQRNLHWYLYDYLRYTDLDTIRLPYVTMMWTAQRAPFAR